MPEGGADEARLTADYNAEMIEHIARFPRVRDRAIFVGAPGRRRRRTTSAPGCRRSGRGSRSTSTSRGYVLAPDAGAGRSRRAARRARLRPDERVCVVTVGGSGVGGGAARRVIEAFPEARAARAGAADARRSPARASTRTRCPRSTASRSSPYVHGLSRHLAACDVAVVQGGLTTCMELAAAKTPFVYFPLKRHFEQNLHVRHRLERYGAGRRSTSTTRRRRRSPRRSPRRSAEPPARRRRARRRRPRRGAHRTLL